MTREAPVVWVCVPTYNEADNVEVLVALLLVVFEEAEIDGWVLIIDDNSPDGTGAIADSLSAREPRVRVLHRERKEGIGPAYLAGFRSALDSGADLVVEMDCDLSHDPRELPALVAAAREADLVLGSRYVQGGETVGWGRSRQVISRGGCLYARRILRVAVRDLTGGFKCFRREVLDDLPLDDVHASGYGFQIEVTYRALLRGFRVREIPITFRERARGHSKMSTGIVLEAALLALRLAIRPPREAVCEQPVPALSTPQS